MGLNIKYNDGQTPIDEDEKEGLLIETISTKAELDEFEQLNIEEAIQWMIGLKPKIDKVFSETFVKELHLRMFGKVWSWAGKFRKTNKNLGVEKWKISTELKALCDDARFWVENETFPADEIAVRFKHRIVSIHCFPNGNGRHSRLMADVIVEKLFKREFFSWGAKSNLEGEQVRAEYLRSLRLADKRSIDELILFARS